MTKRHDALFDDVLSGLGDEAPAPAETAGKAPGKPRGGPKENRFLRRSNALADRAAGTVVEKTLRWVDPARCRMWTRHNRRYDLLTPENCADLIEGFKAQGAQEFPAIVRRLPEGEGHDYEVICGARRHWTVSWLRANNYPKFEFLIEVRELTDEEAFRLADIENRDRRDLSDYERAIDYAAALEAYYGGSQLAMAERLEVSRAWLSRFLDLARLPGEIVAAYPAPTEIRENHARKLKPLLGDEAAAERVLARAANIAALQTVRRENGDEPLTGQEVLARLTRNAAAPKPLDEPECFSGADGRAVMEARRAKTGAATLRIAPAASRADIETAVAAWLDARFGSSAKS